MMESVASASGTSSEGSLGALPTVESQEFLPPMGQAVDRALRRAAERVVSVASSSVETEEPQIMTNAEAGLRGTRQFRFVQSVVVFLCLSSIVGGTALYASNWASW